MSYKIIWTPEAQKDLAYWKQNNKLILKRIFSLVEIVKINPSFGIGKPERLKYKEKNIWSRRIDTKHRVVYLIAGDMTVFVIQCRFHYQAYLY